eukprot:CAMPEP_0198225872 /NCGR_PEP_ID=MMETSP1445-20131203/102856_1 /TAXON_ID=36898 /ORGANISM="Pyramimonas sp., Strain CCMP2087" /LENGTH=252 /DNA_ID=CAMNT_0043905525 /DNA_START=387 /DNA_END=1141 /DNA_ORIENTATION=-
MLKTLTLSISARYSGVAPLRSTAPPRSASANRGSLPGGTACSARVPYSRRTFRENVKPISLKVFQKRAPSSFVQVRSSSAVTQCSSASVPADDSRPSDPKPLQDSALPIKRQTAGRLPSLLLGVTLAVAVALLEIRHGLQHTHVLLIAYAVSLIAATLSGHIVVPLLRCLKAGQVVRLDGPPTHVMLKSGTPTMGGVSFVPVGAVVGVALTNGDPVVLAAAAATLAYAVLGAVDDYGKMAKRDNYAGVSPRA